MNLGDAEDAVLIICTTGLPYKGKNGHSLIHLLNGVPEL